MPDFQCKIHSEPFTFRNIGEGVTLSDVGIVGIYPNTVPDWSLLKRSNPLWLTTR
jgi:hypothetical protein